MNYWLASLLLKIEKRFIALTCLQCIQIPIRIVQMHLPFLIGHFVKGFDKHSQAGILQKEISVHMHETPEQSIPNGLPIALGIVTHFHQVIAATDIGFC